MSKKKKCTDGRRNNRPPESGKFKPGQSGNLKGRPKKTKSTFEDDINDIFGRDRHLPINGETQTTNLRKVILEQIGIGAAKGDVKMIRLAIPFLKIMDDAPKFEMLPDDNKIIEHFKNRFKENGEPKDEE